MVPMRTELMNQIHSFVDQYYCEKHTCPSVNEIAKGVGIPKATSYRYLVAMNDRGMIRYDGKNKSIVTDMISKFADGSVACPVVGSIPCGKADGREESIREYISLPVSLFGKGRYYILEAEGDSMMDAGIEEGDKVVVQTDCTAQPGDIVVALTGEYENTLKKYGGIDEKTREAVLLYQNEEKYPGKEIRLKELSVQGVARFVIKAL